MTQHPSIPAGPRARPGTPPAAAPRPHDLPEALSLSLFGQILLRLLAQLLGQADAGSLPPARRAALLAPLLVLWAALPTRRRTGQTRAHPDSLQEEAEAAATLRAIRRLVACIGWFINGRRNRGMRPAAAQPARPRPLRPPRAPPSAASNGSLPPLAGGGRNPRQHGRKDSESRRQGLVQFIPYKE